MYNITLYIFYVLNLIDSEYIKTTRLQDFY